VEVKEGRSEELSNGKASTTFEATKFLFDHGK
jgi:hypothetical protein